MGGAKRYPSLPVCEDDGFRDGLNPSYALTSNLTFAEAGAAANSGPASQPHGLRRSRTPKYRKQPHAK
jgi:hypothetical protein